jgi:preprotein translocase subunit SecE
MTKVVNYISESFGELKENTTWPTWAEVQKLTVTIALFSITFSLLTYAVDLSFEKIIEGFFKWLKSS